MTRAFVAVGSNIDPASNVAEALRRLARAARVLDISTVYRTEPIDRPEQDHYYNCVWELETDLQPLDLIEMLQRIENELGRVRSADKYAPRTIDLDLIAYGNFAMQSETITLPDPDIATRPFLAIGLAELAPEMKLPGSEKCLRDIASAMSRKGIEALQEYTELLRRKIRERDQS